MDSTSSGCLNPIAQLISWLNCGCKKRRLAGVTGSSLVGLVASIETHCLSFERGRYFVDEIVFPDSSEFEYYTCLSGWLVLVVWLRVILLSYAIKSR